MAIALRTLAENSIGPGINVSFLDMVEVRDCEFGLPMLSYRRSCNWKGKSVEKIVKRSK